MQEWKIYRIGDICKRVCSGGTPKSTEPSYYDGEIPWLNTKEINFNRIISTEKHITLSGLENSSAKWIDKNSVIVAMYGATAAKVAINTIPLTTNQACCNLSIDETKADYRFVYYWLCSRYTELASLANGGAQQNLNAQQIKDFEIKLPEIQTQQKIADLLWSIDNKIICNKSINDNLEQQAQALYKSWFVDFEPFKDGKFEESEIGLIPEGWCVGKAEDFYEINIGKTPPRKEHEWFTLDKSQNIWVSISDLGSDSRFIFDSSEYLTDKAIQKHNIVLVPENTVLLSFKLTIGRVGIAGTQLTTNEAIARFITNSVNREYTYFLLKNFNYSKLGSTSSIATAVNSKIIKAMMVLMPNNESLLNFKKLVGPIIDGIKKNEEEILCLTELRNNLLPKLMSGELKINDLDC